MSFDVYSPNLEERYLASLAYSREHSEAIDVWPRACWGAANGWLMVCDPSPGRQDSDDDVWPGGPQRPIDQNVAIGPGEGHIAFSTNKARNARWQLLTSTVLGSLEVAETLTTVANLDWGHHPDNATIPDSFLAEGCKMVFQVMQKSQP